MRIIVCTDEKNGMLFNKRRQSKDSELRNNLLELTKGSKLWMNEYSATQFTEAADNIHVDDAFFAKAAADDYCFVENTDIAPYAETVNGVILYRWNRTYPSDVKFPAELFAEKWELVDAQEFAGSSHEKITREVYCL